MIFNLQLTKLDKTEEVATEFRVESKVFLQ